MRIVRNQDIFDTSDDFNMVTIIPVNLVGVMGAGLAKQFKEKYPEGYEFYREACLSGNIRTHAVCWKSFWFLPTKDHWKSKSDWDDIELRFAADLKVLSGYTWCEVQVPALGCGLGQLIWEETRPKLISLLLNLERKGYVSEFVLYEPHTRK